MYIGFDKLHNIEKNQLNVSHVVYSNKICHSGNC